MAMFNYLVVFVAVALCSTHESLAFAPSIMVRNSFGLGSTARFAEVEDQSSPVAPPVPKPPVTAKMTMEELLKEVEKEEGDDDNDDYDDYDEPEPAGKLVPIKKETIEFTAGFIGGVAGFAVGGPWAAAVGAAMANYLSKQVESDFGEAIIAVSTTTIEIYNFFAKLDTKYSVLESTQSSLQETLDVLKSKNADDVAVQKVEAALTTTTSKIQDINEEYDLIGSGVSALGFVGEFVENSIKKAGELNSDYKLTNKAMSSIKTAVDRATPEKTEE
uniref:Uncharacterized protein n=1 Tax=Eucampia antarctica TaxID=49252 RepID=A0A7S2WQU7_9STRA|mmetsp:Transcript_9637/g.9288  ORF Transcript_9637/g.9288 Transcript_9637/m.9288 type:complete len:274 (+) Transcript_9637:110-931(+)